MTDAFDREEFFDTIRSVAGKEAVDRLMQTHGGKSLHLPSKAFVGNWLTDLIGLEKAHQVLRSVIVKDADGHALGVGIYVPLGPYSARDQKRIEAQTLFRQGLSNREVAGRIGVSERTASRMKPLETIARPKAPPSAKRGGTPRIGLLETLIIEGKSDSVIAARMGAKRDRIAARRKTLREAGLLKAPTVPPSGDHHAKTGGMVSPADEVKP